MRTVIIVICALLFTLATYPLRFIRRIFVRNKLARFSMNYRLLKKLAKIILTINGANMRLKNEYLSRIVEPVLYVSNHKSNMDSLTMISLIDAHFVFIGKRELSRVPIVGSWFRDIGSIFLERDDLKASYDSILEGISFLKKGVSVLIFPEGMRVMTNGLGDFKAGSFKLATKANVPVMPIAVKGSDGLLELNKAFSPARVNVAFGELIHPDSEQFNNTSLLCASVQKRVQDMYTEFDLRN